MGGGGNRWEQRRRRRQSGNTFVFVCHSAQCVSALALAPSLSFATLLTLFHFNSHFNSDCDFISIAVTPPPKALHCAVFHFHSVPLCTGFCLCFLSAFIFRLCLCGLPLHCFCFCFLCEFFCFIIYLRAFLCVCVCV